MRCDKLRTDDGDERKEDRAERTGDRRVGECDLAKLDRLSGTERGDITDDS